MGKIDCVIVPTDLPLGQERGGFRNPIPARKAVSGPDFAADDLADPALLQDLDDLD